MRQQGRSRSPRGGSGPDAAGVVLTGLPARRAYGLALLLLGAGGVLMIVAYGLTWAVADVPLLAGADGSTREQAVSGRDLYPAAAAAGWVALATVAAVIATRSWGRILVAVVGLVAGVAGIVAAVLFAADPVGAVTGSLDAADALVRARAAGWLLAVVGGLLVVAGAAWTVLRGRAWPGLGSRHERRTRATRELTAWDALDAGQDPTDDLVE